MRSRTFIAGCFIFLAATLNLTAQTGQADTVPWERLYKIKPKETTRMTPADVLGPDGIVYPNWTKCGVQGGIPEVKPVTSIADFGGKADDNADDSQALAKACEAAGNKGGGAVLLGAGVYYLDRPVTVRHDNVVIRGQGPDETRIIFRYAVPDDHVVFYSPSAGGRVGPDTRIEMHAKPTNLEKMTIMIDNTVVGTWTRGQHSGNTFNYARFGRNAIGKVPDGRHTLKGIAEYKDGSKLMGDIPIILDSKFKDKEPVADSRAAITFASKGTVGRRLRLAKDGKRGDMKLSLQSTDGLAVGDCIMIEGPATDRWKKLTKNACLWGLYRFYELVVTEIQGKTITVNQPLRIEFPIIDGSNVQKIEPIRRCGVEGFYLEQTENLWISSVIFSYGWNCWAKDVTIKKCGRFPVYGSSAKWCEIRDCVFDDAWFKGGGGTAYTGWDRCWDCLMENVETFKMRHAPLFQWAASGCVIRKSVFHESDGQWHAGWTHENLIEQCVIESVRGNGGYGYGMWASPPEDKAHGPNGPRNVVYNCDVSSPRAGLWMGGMNENWLILHNRFVVDSGQGVFAKPTSFDHIIQDNVFVLKDGKSPMVSLAAPDCIGIELIGNKLYGGNGKIVSGKAEPALAKGNKVFPLGDAPRPVPKVPSIYEWQRRNAKYLEAARRFADTVIEKGRDTCGREHTPLFVDGLHAVTLEPVIWKKDGQSWVLSNFASQQPLVRLLDGLSALTGDSRYRLAATEATAYALKHLQSKSGLLYWGGHLAWDLEKERAVGQYAGIHEMKSHQPYYRFMWEVDPDSTRKLMGAVWATHILDWSLLDYNRHANTEKPAEPQWNHAFAADIKVPFPAKGSNLSFANVTPPLMHSGTMLAVLDKNNDALKWTRRLAYRWQQAKDPQTGLCGGQLSYRKNDRAQDALGHVHPSINEAKIIATYHQTSRYHHIPLAQMQAAETLLEAGGDYAKTGREFIAWAVEDLKIYADRSYDPDTGKFIALMTDGTPLKWRQAKTGYYVPESFAPRSPDGCLLWSYAMAYRLTQDEEIWNMIRRLAETMGIGDIGSPSGRGEALKLDTDVMDWRMIYVLLELHRATGRRSMLTMACRIADNLLALQTPTGLFPKPKREYARTGDEIPLALLHLAAALGGKSDKMPPPSFDGRFFHCEYHGPLEEHQKKRADKRTYDNYVFYGSP